MGIPHILLEPGGVYHIFNHAVGSDNLFREEENYRFFMQKFESRILPVAGILAYCLMPNHFHFLIHANKRTTETKKVGHIYKNLLSEGVRNLLQSYAKGINKQNHSTGSLFQQNTKAKNVTQRDHLYPEICFYYNHQNPMKAGLVKKMEDWDFSSFKDYAGLRNGTLCNQGLAFELLNLQRKSFYEDSYRVIPQDLLDEIF